MFKQFRRLTKETRRAYCKSTCSKIYNSTFLYPQQSKQNFPWTFSSLCSRAQHQHSSSRYCRRGLIGLSFHMAPAQNAFPAFLEPAARDNYARIHVKNNPSKHNTLARRRAPVVITWHADGRALWRAGNLGLGERGGGFVFVFSTKTAGDRNENSLMSQCAVI